MRKHRESTDELRNQSKTLQVSGSGVLEQVFVIDVVIVVLVPDGSAVDAPFDDFFNACERSTADEQDVLGVDGDEFLLGVLAAALWGYAHFGPFEQLQKCLLNPLTAHVARDGRVVALAGNFVHLVDEDDAAFGLLHVVIRRLEQP